jgi:prepilin-type N-terminal cleavage/methylation domain-containing protein
MLTLVNNHRKLIFSSKGFTLIELMIALVIIGILSTLAVPKLSFFQQHAKLSAVKAFAHNLQLSVEAYYMTMGNYPSSKDTDLDDLLVSLEGIDVMDTVPKNPFTGTSFSADDSAGKITYSFDSSTQLYSISAYDANNSAVILTLNN